MELRLDSPALLHLIFQPSTLLLELGGALRQVAARLGPARPGQGVAEHLGSVRHVEVDHVLGQPVPGIPRELVEQLRKPWQQVAYTIQTNGVSLDADWARFFKEHGFLVGLSVDGPRDAHDAYRHDKGGKGSFDRVMRGYQHLQAAGVDVNVLCTVHAANQDRGAEV